MTVIQTRYHTRFKGGDLSAHPYPVEPVSLDGGKASAKTAYLDAFAPRAAELWNSTPMKAAEIPGVNNSPKEAFVNFKKLIMHNIR